MKQYNSIKVKHPDTILLFRVGDFYETFGKDAVIAAGVLNIILAKRGNGSASEIELAGFPYHSLDNYLPKLVRAGLKVAVCDQLEDPKLAKGLVKRGVTELVTPGVVMHDQVLKSKQNHYLAALHWTRKVCGVAFLDISTGEFMAAQGDTEWIDRLLKSLNPKEWVCQKQHESDLVSLFGDDTPRSKLDDWVFSEEYAEEKLHGQFGTSSLKGFGLNDAPFAKVAAGVILEYLDFTHHTKLGHLQGIKRLREGDGMWLDRFTVRNLEILQASHADGVSLSHCIDRTSTPMGARMLRRWLVMPLTNIEAIEARHNAVGSLLEDEDLLARLKSILQGVGDLERLSSKASSARINPRELVQLRRGLEAVITVAETAAGEEAFIPTLERLSPCDKLLFRLQNELEDEAPNQVGKGAVIKAGVSSELDEVRSLAFESDIALEVIRKREVEITGISSLKIGFNNVFGYYLEVRHSHKDKVPEEWIRKQTLTQAERYITEELKILETKILDAKDKALSIEQRLYESLVAETVKNINELIGNARAMGEIDVLSSFAEIAADFGYTRPRMKKEAGIQIVNGRHPVIERQLPIGESYISNDVTLHPDKAQIIMVTGPNMSGKSALLRQTALICLMAQSGGFVPARSAELGILDRIFTRVGASDNISSGESTFMVEMNETAAILNNITDRSLVLLDEIGRGTSTYDGVSIAWAIAEHLHNSDNLRPLTLFATHYHELNEMHDSFPRILNFNVSVKEVGGKIVFLRKLVPGGSNHSFGIHVAKLAGMPRSLVRRAKEVLVELESHRADANDRSGSVKATTNSPKVAPVKLPKVQEGVQMSFFKLDDPALEDVRDRLLDLDIDTLTPLDALLKLHEIRKVVGGK
ncbi:MAG: DNA mismatch repair protein MutS [Bacteroidetes bacterium]|nr:MAG: DNA mismatch repair protein MutS [Bacteroidota bacterium]